LGRQNLDDKIEYVNQFPSRELEEIESECQTLLNGSIGDLQALGHRISSVPEVRNKSLTDNI
jgi:hypothetical protein